MLIIVIFEKYKKKLIKLITEPVAETQLWVLMGVSHSKLLIRYFKLSSFESWIRIRIEKKQLDIDPKPQKMNADP